ncbi:Membrane-bound transcription factor site-2 protease, partial [Thoreauomyces humboldtii]
MAFAHLVAALLLFWGLVRLLLLSCMPPNTNANQALFSSSSSSHTSTRRSSPSPLLPVSSSTPSSSSSASSFTHSFGQIHYETSLLNPVFRSLGARFARFWRPWFAVGAVVGTTCLVIAVGVLAKSLGDVISLSVGGSLAGKEIHSEDGPQSVDFRANSTLMLSTGGSLGQAVGGNGFVSLIPGVNLPLSLMPYYLTALLVCGVFHELGHALAAVIHRVPVQSSGIFLAVIYPGAFVSLHESTLSLLAPVHRLHIICAGVFHNGVLAILALVALYASPVLLSPGYEVLTNSVAVLGVSQESPLFGHLAVRTRVASINGRGIVGGIGAWEDLLWRETGPVLLDGLCVPKALLEDLPRTCCDVSQSQPLGPPTAVGQCFREHPFFAPAPVTIINGTLPVDPKTVTTGFCLPLHEVMQKYPTCNGPSDCHSSVPDDHPTSSPSPPAVPSEPPSCVAPYIPHPDIRILRLGSLDDGAGTQPVERVVTFLGDPREVWEG